MIICRHGARAMVVAVAAAALVAGCSSTTSGDGSAGSGSGGGVFGSSPGAGASTPAGAAGGSGDFCADWKSINSDLTHLTPGDVRQKLVSRFDTLAAEAPAAVRPDVSAIDQYIHGLLSGNADSSKAQQFGQAFVHVGEWMAKNC